MEIITSDKINATDEFYCSRCIHTKKSSPYTSKEPPCVGCRRMGYISFKEIKVTDNGTTESNRP